MKNKIIRKNSFKTFKIIKFDFKLLALTEDISMDVNKTHGGTA